MAFLSAIVRLRNSQGVDIVPSRLDGTRPNIDLWLGAGFAYTVTATGRVVMTVVFGATTHGNLPGGQLHALAVPDPLNAPASAGFMSGDDKNTLDNRTNYANPLTLVERGELGESDHGYLSVGIGAASGATRLTAVLPSLVAAGQGIYDLRVDAARGVQYAEPALGDEPARVRYCARRPKAVLLDDADALLEIDSSNRVIKSDPAVTTLTLPSSVSYLGGSVLVQNDIFSAGEVTFAFVGDDGLDFAEGPFALPPGAKVWLVAADLLVWRVYSYYDGQTQRAVLNPSGEQLFSGIVYLLETSAPSVYTVLLPNAISNLGRRMRIIATGPGTIRSTPTGADLMQDIIGVTVATDDVVSSGYGEYMAYSDGGTGVWRRLI